MQVSVADDWCLVGNVFDLALSGNLDSAAMPSVDSGLRAYESVRLVDCQFCAEYLGRAGQ